MSEAARAVSRLAAILDLFERERRPLTSRDIAVALAIPRSSLGTLLKAMVELHWLAADRRRATYFPAARLARLGGWLLGTVVIDERVRELVHRLHEETGETISVSAISDLEIEVIHVSSQDVGIQLVVHPGRRISLWRSSVGTAHLATLPDATIRSMHGRSARERGRGAGRRRRRRGPARGIRAAPDDPQRRRPERADRDATGRDRSSAA